MHIHLFGYPAAVHFSIALLEMNPTFGCPLEGDDLTLAALDLNADFNPAQPNAVRKFLYQSYVTAFPESNTLWSVILDKIEVHMYHSKGPRVEQIRQLRRNLESDPNALEAVFNFLTFEELDFSGW